ncbi:MAG: GNAT family N-acetyltransferase [Candidatus Nealsonbacteria bacterium]|nr:GNAT family N-acetyltransferase [Candidatus Nealsonbacteria bacterium]
MIYKTTKVLPAAKLFALYKAVGWVAENKNPKKHGLLLAKVYFNSSAVFSAWDKEMLAGAVRVITDKYAHGVIFGLAVDPRYQGQGMAEELLSRCFKKYPNVQWSVEVEPSAAELFQKQGFLPAKNQYMAKGENPV